jgi:hypothetical protein
MSDLFSGKSGVFTFLLVVLVMIISLAIKYAGTVSLTPAKVSSELEEVFNRVADVRPLSLQKAEFLMEWGRYRDSDECSEAVSGSRTHYGNGFEGDLYVVSYTDSIEFPGFPTLIREFRIEKPMRHNN